ncbi:MAG TPA: WD40 repeat domain-containing protein [Verrucomicrobiae bacterium]|nr:WD40 repeat domain-containing protein [Verrucomicrobiae bacterium]
MIRVLTILAFAVLATTTFAQQQAAKLLSRFEHFGHISTINTLPANGFAVGDESGEVRTYSIMETPSQWELSQRWITRAQCVSDVTANPSRTFYMTDGESIFTGMNPNTFPYHVLETWNGRTLTKIRAERATAEKDLPATFSPDGSLVLMGRSQYAVGSNPVTFTKVATTNTYVRSAAYTPDGKVLVIAGTYYVDRDHSKEWSSSYMNNHHTDDAIEVVMTVDPKTLKPIRQLWSRPYANERTSIHFPEWRSFTTHNVDEAAINPEGTEVAVLTNQQTTTVKGHKVTDSRQGFLTLYTLDGKVKRQFPFKGEWPEDLRYSPDGKTVWMSYVAPEGGQAVICKMDTRTGKKTVIDFLGARINYCAFSEDCRFVATATANSNLVRIWQLPE